MSRFLVVLSFVVFLLSGCGGRSVNENVVETATEPEDTPEPQIVMLPDTSYISAGAVKFVVDTMMPDEPGLLNDISDMYAGTAGAFTFRGGALRDACFGGSISGTPSEIAVDRTFVTDEDYTDTGYGRWGGGTGWTGQPLYVNWPDSCLRCFRDNGVVHEGFSGQEIIVGSLAGNVYFIDFDSGKASRRAIMAGNPVKGTVSLDPSLNGNLYVGQGVPARQPFGAAVIDVYHNEVSHFFGRDPNAWRGWGAYDSSPLRTGQFLIRPGENGTVYKYLVHPGGLVLHSTLRYRIENVSPGIESSVSVYRNYGYVADNHGNVICFNLNDLRPVWRYCLGDDVDATAVVTEENGVPYLYVGCEIDRRGTGDARFVKLNGLDGSRVWQSLIDGERADVDGKHFDGGYYATALPGSGDCSHLVFSNCVLNTKGRNGVFVAFDRDTGVIRYSLPLKYYSWSSPVGFLNERGELYVATADCAGNVYLIRGIDGHVVCSRRVGANFESSPVVTGNHMVIGSRGNSIYRLSIL